MKRRGWKTAVSTDGKAPDRGFQTPQSGKGFGSTSIINNRSAGSDQATGSMNYRSTLPRYISKS